MDFFPIFTQLKNRPVLLVGAGNIAEHKAESLLNADAKVWVIAKQLNPQFKLWQQEGKILHLADEFLADYLQHVFLVIAATDDHKLNRQVFLAAEKHHLFCNVVDDLNNCSFIVPAIIDRSPLQIAISSAGKAPVLARIWRQKIDALIPLYTGRMATIAGKWRERVKTKITTFSERRKFWESLFSGAFNHYIASKKEDVAEKILENKLNHWQESSGEVVLVGAGPGDAGLLTLNAFQALQAADVVLHDALISPEILAMIRKDAEKINVGKRALQHTVKQDVTNDLLVKLAREGKRVVRLKGGDPFVFGRGGEEAEFLVAHHIPFRIVPGITAGLGAAAYAGIPLTHRDYAQSVLFITGHCQENNQLNWSILAKSQQTLVIYMGKNTAQQISQQLIKHGRNKQTATAVVSYGTQYQQQVYTGELQNLAKLAQRAPAPALIVIGEVVKLQKNLNWFKTDAELLAVINS